MALSYDTLGGTINIDPQGAIPPRDLNQAVAIVGSHDTTAADASVTPGEATVVTGRTDAEQQFGPDSELAHEAALAFRNGAATVYGVPVAHTQTTETITAASSGTLTYAPVADPRVTTRDITVTETPSGTDLTVVMVDESPTSSDVDSDEIAIHHRTGEWVADSSSDYEITYEYGDYTAAIEHAASRAVRYVAVCSETASVVSSLAAELDSQARDFRFKRGVVGTTEYVGTSDVGTYSPSLDNWRIIETTPTRATNGSSDAVRTMGAVAGLLADQPIDVTGSITYDDIEGLSDLGVTYPPQVAQQFEYVTAITDTFRIAEGVTTATEDAFSDIYKAEIIDYVIERLHDRITEYRGGPNTQSSQRLFRSQLRRELSSQSPPNAQPPLLADGDGGKPYFVTVDDGASQSETAVEIGIDPAPIAKQVNVDIATGPIQFNGVSV